MTSGANPNVVPTLDAAAESIRQARDQLTQVREMVSPESINAMMVNFTEGMRAIATLGLQNTSQVSQQMLSQLSTMPLGTFQDDQHVLQAMRLNAEFRAATVAKAKELLHVV